VNTSSAKRPKSAPRARKEKHLTICTDPSRFQVEGAGAGFEGVRFIHHALPEIAEQEIDTSTEFLGQRVSLPFFISCMTGGSEGGFRANRALAAAAQQLGIPVGLGSIRVLLKNPALFHHFHIKPIAPDVPILANIGAVQLREADQEELFALLSRLEAQALVVHLNPGQELFQPDGDRDFRGLREVIARTCDRCPLPVIVKETGFGIRTGSARELFAAGASYVDLAGAGGTNWVTVESYLLSARERALAEEFSDWGIPTAMLLASFEGATARLLASGGIRNGVQAAKALAMGAEMAGFALPVIREVVRGGVEAAVAFFGRLEKTLRTVMLLTGSRRVSDLRRGTVWQTPEFAAAVRSFASAEAQAATSVPGPDR
jgi:isopentenyl-diphosphate delta-isomerase type 2